MPETPLRGAWDFPWADGRAGVGRDVTRDGRLPLLGWALDVAGPPTVEISIDGVAVAEVVPTQYREDIDLEFSHAYSAAASLTGWAAAIDVSAFSEGIHTVTVVARAGQSTLPLGSRAMERPRLHSDDDELWRTDAVTLLRCPRTREPVARAGEALESRDGIHRYPIRGHQAYFSSEPGSWLSRPTSAMGFSAFAQDLMWRYGFRGGVPALGYRRLTEELAQRPRLRALSSATGFSRFAGALMRRPGFRVLAIGAGLSRTVPGVIQLDIFDYPNIDVVCDTPELPFVDGAFDGVVCENVIEHVPDPFALVSEIDRVLKPGGYLGLNGTNLHFTHGFPSHYFNPTEFGMRYLLETRGRFDGEYAFTDVPHSLRTVLGYYLTALEPKAREQVSALTVGELWALVNSSAESDARTALGRVSDIARRALSTNIYFSGRKRT